jgi:hypothetical protein
MCTGPFSFVSIGRDDRIRTCDPLTPSQVRYQAALHPVRAIDQLFFRRVFATGATFSSNSAVSPADAAGDFASITDNSRSPRWT